MRQSDSVSEELDTENVQCALDFENTMNELETQLYYRHLPPKEVALRVMEAACKFYDADWCGLIQVDQQGASADQPEAENRRHPADDDR